MTFLYLSFLPFLATPIFSLLPFEHRYIFFKADGKSIIDISKKMNMGFYRLTKEIIHSSILVFDYLRNKRC